MFGNQPGSPGNGTGSRAWPTSNMLFPQLDHKAVSDFVDQFSVAIKYWKAMQCPCVTPETGQPNISCFSCRGLGFTYGETELNPIYQRAQVHSRRSESQSGKAGRLIPGSCSVTFKPGVIPGDGDLIQICQDKEVINNEYHVVGSTLNNGATAERLRFRDIVCVENVIVWDKDQRQALPVNQSDWSFDKDQRRIVWKNGLPEGSKYSVRYIATPEYIVLGETSKPLLRVAHDDNEPDPASYRKDIVYPYNVIASRLDRAILQRNRENTSNPKENLFDKKQGKKGIFA